jgi:hypothetical protein
MVRPVRLTGPKQRAYAKTLIDGADDGWIVSIKEPTRTNEQNALLWSLLQDLSDQVEWPVNGVAQKLTKEDWKDLATAALVSEQRVAAGMDGGCVFLGRRTSTLSKRVFSDLVEVIRAFGSRHGVVWTDPNPYAEAAE